jgi:hypothetical protein
MRESNWHMSDMLNYPSTHMIKMCFLCKYCFMFDQAPRGYHPVLVLGWTTWLQWEYVQAVIYAPDHNMLVRTTPSLHRVPVYRLVHIATI